MEIDMDFSINADASDEEGNSIVVTHNLHATLESGIATIFLVDDEEIKTAIISQPWKTNGDGSRSVWVDINEVVAWFQEQPITL
jgi:hypothetical protein